MTDEPKIGEFRSMNGVHKQWTDNGWVDVYTQTNSPARASRFAWMQMNEVWLIIFGAIALVGFAFVIGGSVGFGMFAVGFGIVGGAIRLVRMVVQRQ